MLESSSLSQYCEIATCMGITDCYLAKTKLGKTFWSVLVIAGIIMTTYQTYLSFAEYLNESPFQISVSQEASDNGIMFPNITICNFNRAKQSLINATNLDPKVLSAMFQLTPTLYDIPLAWNADQIPEYQAALTNYQRKNNESDFRTFYQKYGHNADETTLMLTFGGQPIMYSETFTEVFNVYGRCWKININQPQTVPGSFSGVKLLLNPQLSEYMKNVVFNNYFQQGFAVSLSYNDEPVMSDAIMLSPGTASNIVMAATRNSFTQSQFPTKELPCRKDTSFKILKAVYTPMNCISECYLQAMYDACGCILLAETQSTNIPFCNMTVAIQCAMSNPVDYNKSSNWVKTIGVKSRNCSESCQKPCDDFMTIQATLSTTKMNIDDQNQARAILKAVGTDRNWSEEFVADAAQNGVMAKIYFSSTDLIVVETGETTPIMTFIGNVGGQLGLWVGISLLSIIQVLYYVFLACLNGDVFCKEKKTKIEETPMKNEHVFYIM